MITRSAGIAGDYFMTRRDRDDPMIVMAGTLHGHWTRGGKAEYGRNRGRWFFSPINRGRRTRGGKAEYGRNGWERLISPIKCGRGIWAKSG